MVKPPRNVLVLGSDSRSFLSVVRSLGRKNLRMHAAGCGKDVPAYYSKYIQAVHSLPDYREGGEAEWLHAIRHILRKEDFDLIVPCADSFILPFHIHREELSTFTQLAIPDEDVFPFAFDKCKMHELVSSLHIPLPKSHLFQPGDEWASSIAHFTFPLVIKPQQTFSLENLSHRNDVQKAYSESEFHRIVNEFASHKSLLVQEFFTGTGIGVEVLVDQGNILFAFQHRRIHEPLHGGGSSYRKSVPLDAELLQATQTITQALNYTGLGMFEYKYNFQTGEWIFIELNARVWGSLPLALACGADFPFYLYQFLVEGRKEFPDTYKTNIYCRNTTLDLRWMWHNLRANRNDPTLNALPLHRVFLELFNPILLRERNDTLVLDDPKPAFIEGYFLFHHLFTKMRYALWLRFLHIPFIRKIISRNVRQKLDKAQKILFVCKGNICRSPFAQRAAEQIFKNDKDISSSGYYPEENRPSPETAIEAASQFAIDLSAHRSSIIDETKMQEADIIFVFDRENDHSLRTHFPFAKGKIEWFGLLSQNGAIEIEDPNGKELADFQQVYQRIIEMIK